MDEEQAYLDGAQRIMKYVKQTFKDTFTYFIGSPDEIPEDALPCLVVQKVAGQVSIGATNTDDLTEQIMIHILVNGKEGFNTPDDDDTVMRQLFNLVEARDPVTGSYKPTTLMYILRHNLTLGNTVINNDVETNYDVTPRAALPSIVEGIVIVTLYEKIYVLNRN